MLLVQNESRIEELFTTLSILHKILVESMTGTSKVLNLNPKAVMISINSFKKINPP